MTREEIKAFFIPGTPLFFGGKSYAVPTLAWLLGDFYRDFHAALWHEDVSAWSPRFECRDFARSYACLAQIANAHASNTPDGDDAIAVGEIWFHPDANPPTQDHAVNAAITDEGLVFIDPQTGLVVTLKPSELLTVKFARF